MNVLILFSWSQEGDIEILEARRDVTVAFTDIQMPGSMDGLKRPRGQGPLATDQFVATSAQVDVREIDLPEGGRLLPKPYSPVQVTGVLREVTGGGFQAVIPGSRRSLSSGRALRGPVGRAPD